MLCLVVILESDLMKKKRYSRLYDVCRATSPPIYTILGTYITYESEFVYVLHMYVRRCFNSFMALHHMWPAQHSSSFFSASNLRKCGFI